MIVNNQDNPVQLLIDAIKHVANDKNLSYETKLLTIRQICKYYIVQIDKRLGEIKENVIE